MRLATTISPKWLLVSFLAISATDARAQDAHRRDICGAHSDQKGLTCVTIDYDDSARIWNLADGRHLTTLSVKSAEWATKLLRHKINHPDFVSSGEKWNWPEEERKNGVTPSVLTVNGELVAKLVVAPEYYVYNRPTGKLISYEMAQGQTKIYTHEIPPSGAASKVTKATPLATIPGTSYLFFSPRATWIYQPSQLRLISPESGNTVTVNGLKPYEGMSTHFAFSADELQLAVVTADGIAVIDARTGNMLRQIRLPKKLKREELVVYPQTDMQSFVYTGSLFTKTKKAYLVKEDSITPLHD